MRKRIFRAVLELKEISVRVGDTRARQTLLQDVSFCLQPGRSAAIIGPSGSGKSTLLKAIAGIHPIDGGTISWHGKDLSAAERDAGMIGYVPQFTIAHPFLTIRESLVSSMRLRSADKSKADVQADSDRILEQTGLASISDRIVRSLSGGESRRLSLALELVSAPDLLLCDEVLSGLDPKGESEIAELVRELAEDPVRLVATVTHTLRHPELYRQVVVLHEGRLAYAGDGEGLLNYFGVAHPEEVYVALSNRTGEEWHNSRVASAPAHSSPRREAAEIQSPAEQQPRGAVAGAWTQLGVLLERRAKEFMRDRRYAVWQLALLLGFPCLVVIFTHEGLPQIRNQSMSLDQDVIDQLRETISTTQQTYAAGTLLSGIVMFQVVLLALTACNNGAREIAGERRLFEKERLAGLNAGSYVAGKVIFLSALVLIQSTWMAVFVDLFAGLPGSLLTQIFFLVLINGAVTCTCLAVSSTAPTAEQASLVSIYLVGFQLPLSGAVLALPEFFAWITRPFIAAYWSWSGVLQTMRETRLYDAVVQVTQTDLSRIPLCAWVLASHIVIMILTTYSGCRSARAL
jgi:ABC-type multidrug transport system ATPase subunit